MDVLPLVAKTSLHRSPNAATCSLQECLEGASKVSRVEDQVATCRESTSEHLSLASQSGFLNQKLSSLREYGLLEAIRKCLRIGDLFLRIEHAHDETERRRALREALRRPTIFQRLLTQYEQTGLPSVIDLIN